MSDLAYWNGQSQLRFEKSEDIVINFAGQQASGTHGIFAAPVAGISTFTDSTANAFTAAMVGMTITVSGSTQGNTNNGTFIVVGYTSASVISVYSPYAVVDTAVDVWTMVGNPTIVAGDVANQYLTIQRCGTGLYAITSTDGFPECLGHHCDLIPANSLGTWHAETQLPVQNSGGFHPYFYGKVPATINSWTLPFYVYSSSTAGDPAPATATGTHGAPAASLVGAAYGAGYCIFQDTTANNFTPIMVGSSIVVSGGAANNNGTFTVLAWINAQTIIISNATATVASGLTWTITTPARMVLELTFDNGVANVNNAGNVDQ